MLPIALRVLPIVNSYCFVHTNFFIEKGRPNILLTKNVYSILQIILPLSKTYVYFSIGKNYSDDGGEQDPLYKSDQGRSNVAKPLARELKPAIEVILDRTNLTYGAIL